MKKQITNVSTHQSAKVIAALYAVAIVPIALIGSVATMVSSKSTSTLPAILFLASPFIYGALGYVFFALFCWLYNTVAQSLGGLEFTVSEVPSNETP